MKIACVDLETSPATAHVWTMFQANVSLAQLLESSRMLSFAWQWVDSNRVEFRSEHHDGHEQMVARLYELWHEADALVTWNGDKFDIPIIRREFLTAGFTPPKGMKSFDLVKVARKQFRFQSNKLDYVAGEILGEHKLSHAGHQLWVDCLNGDAKAWSKMRAYNIQDTKLTTRLWHEFKGYIPSYFEVMDEPRCSKCGSDDLERRGFAYTDVSKYQQFRCRQCGGWSRSTVRSGRGQKGA